MQNNSTFKSISNSNFSISSYHNNISNFTISSFDKIDIKGEIELNRHLFWFCNTAACLKYSSCFKNDV